LEVDRAKDGGSYTIVGIPFPRSHVLPERQILFSFFLKANSSPADCHLLETIPHGGI
jgi:hypothetical protein